MAPFRYDSPAVASFGVPSRQAQPTPTATVEPDYDRLGEQVHAGPSGIPLPWFFPYYDRLDQTPIPPRILRRMFSNGYVKAAILGKLFSVASLDLQVRPHSKKDPTDQETAKFLEWQWTERLQGGVGDFIWSVLSGGLIDGYSICELVWALERDGDWAGKLVLDRVKPKDVENDVVTETDPFRNIISIRGMRYNAGEYFNPDDFVVWQHLPFFNQPVGTSDFKGAYADFVMLDTTNKLRMICADKRAIPMLMGHYTNTTQKAGLDAALSRARSQTWLSLPEGVKVEALNMAGSADNVFDKFTSDLKHSIYLSICGAVLQSLEGSVTDSRGSSKVHKSQADLFKWYLSDQMEKVLNKIGTKILDLNYQLAHYPKTMLSAVDVTELALEMSIDAQLHGIGVDLSLDEMYDRYGRSPPENPGDVLKGAPPTGQPVQAAPGSAVSYEDQPAAGVAGPGEFRGFSEEWQRYIRGER